MKSRIDLKRSIIGSLIATAALTVTCAAWDARGAETSSKEAIEELAPEQPKGFADRYEAEGDRETSQSR